MPRIAVNGADLHYEDTGGAGPAIVFAHGLLLSGRMFDAQVAALRSRYRCIAYDHRGQGKSAVTPDGYDMETIAQDAAALIRALNIGPCHFVGLSMGGFAGMRLAARAPGLIRSLTLIATTADAASSWEKTRYAALGFFARTFGMRVVLGEAMKALLGRTFLEDPTREVARLEMRALLLALNLDAALRALRGVAGRASIERELPAIRCPTLVLSGEEDRSIAPELSRRTAGLIPGARFQLMPRVGHTATVEEPHTVTDAIGEFLASLEPRAA
jgi:3-oxoadipate enol-lactonase